MSKWVKGEVVDQRQWAPGLFSLWVKAPIAPFIAGQFTQLALNETGQGFRPYSFANSPDDALLEFYYTRIEGGKLTPALADLTKGADIWVAQRAVGRFILADIPASEVLWLFATGTGLGVFLSILKTEEPWQRFTKIVLVHSTRKASELTHLDLIQSWQARYPHQFHWVPTVTQESIKEMREYRVTTLLASGELEACTGLPLNAETAQVMLCGNPAMLTEMTALLQARGLRMNRLREPGHITTESYWKA